MTTTDIDIDNGVRTYELPAYRLPLLERMLDTTNNRLTRAGIAGRFSVDRAEEFTTTKRVGAVTLDDGTAFGGTEVTEPWIRVTINMVPLMLGAYTFVASLVPEEAGIITRVAPGQDLHGHRPQDMGCEHCGLDRRRTRAYIVRNNDTGKLTQVGHSCIELYCGLAPKGLWLLGFDQELQAFADDDTGAGFTDGDYGVPLADVLGMAFAFSDRGRSYVSRNAAENSWGGLEATGAQVRRAIFYPPTRPATSHPDAVADYHRFIDTARQGHGYAKDAALVADIVAAADTLAAGSDYAENVAILLKGEHVSGRSVGLLASLVSVYAREKELAVMRAAAPKPATGYLAEVGVRIKTGIRLTVRTVRFWESDYGTTTFMVGYTDAGNCVVWKASGEHDWAAGGVLVLAAGTVKAHEQYNGVDQTILTRCKVESYTAAG